MAIPTITYPFVSFASARRFYPFGDPNFGINGNTAYQVQLTDTGQYFVTACSGIVTSVSGQTVSLIYKTNSVYSFEYTGVRSPLVHVSDSLPPGALLGKVSADGIIGFALVKDNHTALCPATYANAGFNTAIQLAIDKNNQYNPADSVLGPCEMDEVEK